MRMTRAVQTFCLILAVSLLAGCPGLLPGPQTPPATQDQQAAMQMKADEAWRAARYDRALQLYTLILEGQALTREAKVMALARSAEAALRLNRAPEAMNALAAWTQADPNAKNTWEWNSLYVQALSAGGREQEAVAHLAKLLQTRNAPYALTSLAAIELAKHYAQNGQSDQAIRTLRAQRAKAPSMKDRARIEATTSRMLGMLDPASLGALLAAVNTANALTYPYNLVALENARRQATASPAARGQLKSWPTAWGSRPTWPTGACPAAFWPWE